MHHYHPLPPPLPPGLAHPPSNYAGSALPSQHQTVSAPVNWTAPQPHGGFHPNVPDNRGFSSPGRPFNQNEQRWPSSSFGQPAQPAPLDTRPSQHSNPHIPQAYNDRQYLQSNNPAFQGFSNSQPSRPAYQNVQHSGFTATPSSYNVPAPQISSGQMLHSGARLTNNVSAQSQPLPSVRFADFPSSASPSLAATHSSAEQFVSQSSAGVGPARPFEPLRSTFEPLQQPASNTTPSPVRTFEPLRSTTFEPLRSTGGGFPADRNNSFQNQNSGRFGNSQRSGGGSFNMNRFGSGRPRPVNWLTADLEGSTRYSEFWCECCDRGYANQRLLDLHLSKHIQCEYPGCKFQCMKQEQLEKHILFLHVRFAHVDVVDTEKYLAERRRRYPTKAVVQIKKRQAAIRKARGDVLPEETSAYRKRLRTERLAREKDEARERRIAMYKQRMVWREARSADRQQRQQQQENEAEQPPQSEANPSAMVSAAMDEEAKATDAIDPDEPPTETSSKNPVPGPRYMVGTKRNMPFNFQSSRTPGRKRRMTLLQKLLRASVFREKRHLLQVLRYFVRTDFLTKPVDWGIDEEMKMDDQALLGIKSIPASVVAAREERKSHRPHMWGTNPHHPHNKPSHDSGSESDGNEDEDSDELDDVDDEILPVALNQLS